MGQLTHPYMTTGKTVSLTIKTFVSKVLSLLCNALNLSQLSFQGISVFLISWLSSPSIVIFGAQENKICTAFTFSPSICHEVVGTICHDLSVLNVGFQAAFSLSSTLIKRLLSSSLLSSIRVVSSAYLRLLVFLPEILIPACDSFTLAFCMMYSACKLNKQHDSIQP